MFSLVTHTYKTEKPQSSAATAVTSFIILLTDLTTQDKTVNKEHVINYSRLTSISQFFFSILSITVLYDVNCKLYHSFNENTSSNGSTDNTFIYCRERSGSLSLFLAPTCFCRETYRQSF